MILPIGLFANGGRRSTFFDPPKKDPTPMTREFQKNNSPENIAQPTVGRIVHFFWPDNPTPFPAMVVEVLGGSLTIQTACVFLGDGVNITQQLKHKSERLPNGAYWDWMEFQKGQAAKTEALEVELKRAAGI